LNQGRASIFQENPSLLASGSGYDKPAPRPNRDLLLPILWRQRWVIVLSGILGLALGVAYQFLATPVYTSTARMKVIPAAGRANGEQSISDSVNVNYLNTEAELIQSPVVLALAAQMPDVKPLIDAEPDKIQFLQKYLSVELGKRDTVLTVAFSSPDKFAAAAISNAIVAAYKKYQVTPKQSTLGDVEHLQREIANLDAEIQSITTQMSALENGTGALDLGNPQSTIAQRRLDDLSKKLTEAQLDLATAEANNETADRIIRRLKLKGVDTEAIDSEIIGLTPEQQSRLPSDIAMVRRLLADSPYLEGHPQHKRLQEQLDNLELTYAKVLQGQLERARLSVRTLETQVAKAQADAKEVSIASLKYARLQKEWENDQKLKDKDLNQLQEVRYARELGVYQIDVFEDAQPELRPSSPKKRITFPAGLLFGLLVGSGLAFFRDWRDDRYRTVDEIKESMGVPVLGTIPRMPEGLPAPLAGQQAMLEPASAVAEACRTIRTAIYFGAPKDRCRTLHITSPASTDGKSTLAANLAITMAQAGKRVLLIDADLRLPVQHSIFGVRHEHGLSSVVYGKATLDQAIQPTAVSGLEVLPCGPKPTHPTELLNSPMFSELLEVLSDRYDQVIIDSPPVMGIADARIISASCDLTVLVLRSEKSTRRVSELARDGLLSVGANLLGIVINQADAVMDTAYGYYDYTRSRSPQAKLAAKN
jgi:capsular exopolysaccharide synthesis family protein